MRRAKDDLRIASLRDDAPAALPKAFEQVLAGLVRMIEGRRSRPLAGDAIGAPISMRVRTVTCELDQQAHPFTLTCADA